MDHRTRALPGAGGSGDQDVTADQVQQVRRAVLGQPDRQPGQVRDGGQRGRVDRRHWLGERVPAVVDDPDLAGAVLDHDGAVDGEGVPQTLSLGRQVGRGVPVQQPHMQGVHDRGQAARCAGRRRASPARRAGPPAPTTPGTRPIRDTCLMTRWRAPSREAQLAWVWRVIFIVLALSVLCLISPSWLPGWIPSAIASLWLPAIVFAITPGGRSSRPIWPVDEAADLRTREWIRHVAERQTRQAQHKTTDPRGSAPDPGPRSEMSGEGTR
jgi:hypothetical protein